VKADLSPQIRLLNRYRLMFRFSLTMVAIGAVVAAGGVLVWMVVGHPPAAVPWGLMTFSLGGLSAYKVVTSTVRVLSRATGDVGTHNKTRMGGRC
jgi:hypothetical protein